MSESTLTSLTVYGVAEAAYDMVIFNMSTVGTGDTAAAAKEEMRFAVDAIQSAVATLNNDHGMNIDPKRYSATYSIAPCYVHDRKSGESKQKGYQAVYHVSLPTRNVELVATIMDRLTSIERVSVESPIFKLKNLKALHRKGLRAAEKLLRAQFADECAVLGFNPANYTIVSFSTHYDMRESMDRGGGHLMMYSASVGSSRQEPAPVEITSTEARVTVRLQATFGPIPSSN